MGQQTGAGYFLQGNIGWEGYDQVAMGNKIIGGGYPVNFSTATNCRFEYNTVVDPDQRPAAHLELGPRRRGP